MKKLLYIIAVCALAGACGCGRQEALPGQPFWPATGNRDFDSLSVLLLNDLDLDKDRSAISPYVLELKEIERRDSGNVLMTARMAFFESCVVDGQRSTEILSNALATLDSAQWPHDYNRLVRHYARNLPDKMEALDRLDGVLKYCGEVGDSDEIAAVSIDLGFIYWYIREPEMALSHALVADKIYKLRNHTSHYHNNKINIALFSPPGVRDTLTIRLLNDSLLLKSPLRYYPVLLNSFLFTDSLELLNRAIDIADSLPSLAGDLVKLNDLKGNWFKLRHRPETALQSYYKAISLIDSSTDDRHKSILARDLAGVYTELNKPDSALKYLWRHLELEDTIDKVSHRDEVYAADMKQRLERAKLQNEMQLKSSRIMTVAVVCATIAVSLLVILIIHRRNSRRQLKALQTEAELRRTRHRVVARSATLEENRRLINNIRDLARDGAASDSLADEITKTLQLHDISEPERDTFMQINDRLDPDFRARLKNDFPSLSEAQLRMAQYIAIGMPNQHIARMLNISYDSVKKARWRLRSAMGLLRPQKLEDALRRYS